MNRICVVILCSSVGTILYADDAPVSIDSWRDSLLAIAKNYPPGATQAQTALQRKNLVTKITEQPAARVQMSSRVRDVRWRNGIAEVFTEPFLAKTLGGLQQPVLSTSRVLPFELKMDEVTAASIEPGARVTFKGTLRFHPYRHGAVGRAIGEQQLHTISHTKLPGTPLGTYTSADCIITVAGKHFPTRWQP